LRNRPEISSGALELGFSGAALLIFFVCIWLLPIDHDNANVAFVLEVIRQYGFAGSSDQRWAYLTTVILVLVLCSAATILTRRHVVKESGDLSAPKVSMSASILASCIIIAAYGTVMPLEPVVGATCIVASYVAAVMMAGRLSRPFVNALGLVAIALYLAILINPTVIASPISLMVADPDALAQFENHLAWLTMPASAIAAGQNMFSDVQNAYGVLWPAIMSVIDHDFGRLTIGDQLRFVQIAQVLFCLCATFAYLVWKPRSYVAVFAVMLLAGPYWTATGLGIWHPNQTGFRALGFPLCFLVLALVGRAELKPASLCLGVAAAIATLLNFETAAAISSGYVVYLGMRTRSFPIVPLLRMALAGGVIFAIFIITYRLALGRLPISFDQYDPQYLLRRFTTGGYGVRLFRAGTFGENYLFVPIALLMLGHATLVLIRAFLRVGFAPVFHREAFRAGVAATLLVWLSYYFNAPSWWQIWTHLFLYGFLLLDLLDPRLLGIGVASIRGLHTKERWARAQIRIGRLAALLLVAFAIPYTNGLLVEQSREFAHPAWIRTQRGASTVSDILMPKELGEALQAKARALEEENDAVRGDLIYFTYNTAFIPALTGLFQPEPYRNLWGAQGEAEFQSAMASVLARRVSAILIDAPDGPLATTGQRSVYQDRWRAIVARDYRKAATKGGWEIWKPAD
jgi:hypothetical protein